MKEQFTEWVHPTLGFETRQGFKSYRKSYNEIAEQINKGDMYSATIEKSGNLIAVFISRKH